MRLKSYHAATLPEAIKLARDELGPDAVILSSQPSERGSGIRLTAALDDGLLDDVATAAGDGRSPLDDISEALVFHRVPPGLSDRLIAAAAAHSADRAELALAGALDAVFHFRGQTITLSNKPILLVGPPGAGKTATAAKLCALARLDGKSAALITMDTVKAGALAQAAILADTMDVTLREATDEASLLEAVGASAGADLSLVDTVGANPFDPRELGLLTRVSGALDAEVVLVLPAGGDAMESADLALAFADAGARLLCPTRLDAARRLGGLLAAASAAELAFFAAGIAPQIAGGLAPVTPVALARHLLHPQDADDFPATTLGSA